MNYRERNFRTEFKAAQLEATVGEVGLIEDIALKISEAKTRVRDEKLGLIKAVWKNMRFFESDIFTELTTMVFMGKNRYINEVRGIYIAEKIEHMQENQDRVSKRADSNKKIGIAYTAYGVPIESLKILANTDRSGPWDDLDNG